MNRRILNLTLPNIISNITVPLLGMVDLAIVGHIGGSRYIGAIAIGTAIFNLIYWNFGFLRMGTTGFTAQAYGRRDLTEAVRILVRGASVAVAIAVVLIVLQSVIGPLAVGFMGGEGELSALAQDYFYVRIWAAPATLMLYVFKGWFIGMQNTRFPMFLAITLNIVNIVASTIFALALDMGIEGVALGTVVAQYSGIAISLLLIATYYRKLIRRKALEGIFKMKAMAEFFVINRDIFLRTICLVAVFTFFTRASAQESEMTLAVNTLLLQLFTLFSYFMDGFAYSGEALVGRFVGAKDQSRLRLSVVVLIWWGVGISLIFTTIYSVMLTPILSIFTSDEEVLVAAMEYRWWVAAVPLAGFLAFLYDGILVGATQTAIMRNIMYGATALFFGVYYLSKGAMGDDALWLAFIVYLSIRGIGQFLGSYKLFFHKR